MRSRDTSDEVHSGRGIRYPAGLQSHIYAGAVTACTWNNARAPYPIEPMGCLSFSNPSRDLTFKKSHQIGGTEIGVNLFGYIVDQRPCSVVIVLPTIGEDSWCH